MESKIELCIRNFPDTFSESDISDFLARFGISAPKFLKRRKKISAIISATDEPLAKCILARLHQLKVADKRLWVEYYDRKEVEVVDAEPVAVKNLPTPKQSAQELGNFAKALHAVHPVDFSQPPPPYLRYRYPKPTREIIDGICVALESVPKFYTQVLHLMNRMNLPPPFTPQHLQRKDPVRVEKKDACQQTDLAWIKDSLLAEGESELESDEEPLPKVPVKHKLGLNKNRFKPYGLPQPNAVKNKPEPLELFEHQTTIKSNPKIQIRVPEEFNPVRESPTHAPAPPPPVEPEPSPTLNNSSLLTESHLLANRIPPNQLAELPVFKNYSPGPPSNKLYIKNLAKTVTEEDLRQIFHLFAITADPGREIDIKLMQSGRMKGQAFVTFSYLYEEDLERLPEKPIERALRLTNGFILKDKPMVVVYGKATPAATTATGGEKAS